MGSKAKKDDLYIVLRNVNGGTFPDTKDGILAALGVAYGTQSERFRLPIFFETSPGGSRRSRFKITVQYRIILCIWRSSV